MAAKTPKTVYVDFGDGKLAECMLGSGNTTLTSQLGANKNITIYGYDESYCDLTILSMSNVALEKADISKLKDLTTLTLANAGLTEIDLSNNTLLGFLTLSDCNLEQIDLSKLTNLTNVSLNNNKLSAIDLSNNTKLATLQLSDNNLKLWFFLSFPPCIS